MLRCGEMASFSKGPPTAPPSPALVRASHFASAPRPVDSSRRQDDEKEKKRKKPERGAGEREGKAGATGSAERLHLQDANSLSVDLEAVSKPRFS